MAPSWICKSCALKIGQNYGIISAKIWSQIYCATRSQHDYKQSMSA
jgi:hypothetical protein